MKHQEAKDGKRIKYLEKMVQEQTIQLTEVKNYAKWDEIAHEEFTEELIASGLKIEELVKEKFDKKYQ